MANQNDATVRGAQFVNTSRVEFFGCPFDRVGMQSTIDRCLAWCDGPRVLHTVITLNAALLCMMRRDEGLRAACRGGGLIVAAGVPVVRTSRLAGIPWPGGVAGGDHTARLFHEAVGEGVLSLFL